MTDASVLQVLVVDDNRSAAEAAALLIRREGHSVEVAFDGETAVRRLQAAPFDLVFTDLRMEPVDGLTVVRAARGCVPPVEAIVVTAFGSVEAAVEAMRHGALDFLTKPITADQLLRRVRTFRSAPMRGLALVGESPFMDRLRKQAVRLAGVRSTVLLLGETGTGRRHLARWLHDNGSDAHGELQVAQPGRDLPSVDPACPGTLLLPRVDNWSSEAQVRLLRQLEALSVEGAPRIIATASPELDETGAAGSLLPELYFRLAVLVVGLAPLRDRPGDLAPLLLHFLTQHSRRLGRPRPEPSPEQVARLAAHAWPGNLRELANLAERALVLGSSALNIVPTLSGDPPPASLAEGFSLSAHMETVERSMLERAIAQTQGDRTAMARLLGLERNTLRYKLNKYDLLKRT